MNKNLATYGIPTRFKKGGIPWNKDRPHPTMIGNQYAKGNKLSEETKKKIGLNGFHYGMLNKKHSEETKLKMHQSHKKGKDNPNWKGGITSQNAKIRNSFEFKQWRETIFKRDDYRCISCGERGNRLHADHILPFAQFSRLRFDINNGRTLCIPCHKQTETYGRKAIKFSIEGRSAIYLTA